MFMKVSGAPRGQKLQCADYSDFIKQVFVTALEGYVPVDIIRTLNAFLDFCYIVRKDVLTEDSLDALDDALRRFHQYHKIFKESSVRPTGFSLPRQHSLVHYRLHIEKFGAPNGLSSSITESKHIAAVKKPWRQSSRYEVLKQMLVTNTRNDKLAAAWIDFTSRGMLAGTCLSKALERVCDDPDVDMDNSEMGTVSEDDNGEGQGFDADERENQTGPVDDPFVLSKVVLALKKGKSASLHPTLNTPKDLGQHAATPRRHFPSLGDTYSKRTWRTLFECFSFIDNTRISPDYPLSLPARLSSPLRTSPFFTPPQLYSTRLATLQASEDCTARQSAVPPNGKPVASWHPERTALFSTLGCRTIPPVERAASTLPGYTCFFRLRLERRLSNAPSFMNSARRTSNRIQTMECGSSNQTTAVTGPGSCPSWTLILSFAPRICCPSSTEEHLFQRR